MSASPEAKRSLTRLSLIGSSRRFEGLKRLSGYCEFSSGSPKLCILRICSMYWRSAASSPSASCCAGVSRGSDCCSNEEGTGSQVPGATGPLLRFDWGAKSPPSAHVRSQFTGTGADADVVSGMESGTDGPTRLATSPSIFCSTCEMRLVLVQIKSKSLEDVTCDGARSFLALRGASAHAQSRPALKHLHIESV